MRSDSDAFNYVFVLADHLRRLYHVQLAPTGEPTLTVTDVNGDRVEVVVERQQPATRYRISLVLYAHGAQRGERIPIDAAAEDVPDVIAVIAEHLARG